MLNSIVKPDNCLPFYKTQQQDFKLLKSKPLLASNL